MSEHKVPQDVESEDKILGPFSFRQFIYLLIAAAGGFVAFGLSRLAIPLAILPSPIIILFLVLALPLKKDQTMEKYLAALIKFIFMPHLRTWMPGDTQSNIEITSPSLDEDPIATKIQGNAATQRLSFLAEMEDSQGQNFGFEQTSLNAEFVDLENRTPDILDESAMTESLDKRLAEVNKRTREDALAKIQQVITTPTIAQNTQGVATPTTVSSAPAPAFTPTPTQPQTVVNDITNNETALEDLLAKGRSAAAAAAPASNRRVIQPLNSTPTQAQPQTQPQPSAPAPQPVQPAPQVVRSAEAQYMPINQTIQQPQAQLIASAPSPIETISENPPETPQQPDEPEVVSDNNNEVELDLH